MTFIMKMWCKVSNDEWEADTDLCLDVQCPSQCEEGCKIRMNYTIFPLTAHGYNGEYGIDYDYAVDSSLKDNGDGSYTYEKVEFFPTGSENPTDERRLGDAGGWRSSGMKTVTPKTMEDLIV